MPESPALDRRGVPLPPAAARVSAIRDPLTGFLGRQGLRASLAQRLERRAGSEGLIFKLAIDQAELVAEAGGDAAFDAVLVELAGRLQGLLRAHDVLARPERDRLAVLFADAAASWAQPLATKLLSAVSDRPFAAPLGALNLTLSIGAASITGETGSVDELFARANSALRHAQGLGGNRLCHFDEVPLGRMTSRHDFLLADRLRKALDAGRMKLAYQPVVDAGARTLRFAEGLARLATGAGRMIAARSFVPIAERLGLSYALDCQAIAIALARLDVSPDLRLAVNVSAMTVGDRRAVEGVLGRLRDSGGAAARLILEITETAAIKDLAGCIGFVEAVRATGAAIALDDFGSGHTAFAHLRALRPSIVKIDRGFVRNLETDPDCALFVGALATLARGLKAETVAEGVETEAQAERLRALGIDMLQGFAIGAPSTLV